MALLGIESTDAGVARRLSSLTTAVWVYWATMEPEPTYPRFPSSCGMRTDQAARQLSPSLFGKIPYRQRTETGRYPVDRLRCTGMFRYPLTRISQRPLILSRKRRLCLPVYNQENVINRGGRGAENKWT